MKPSRKHLLICPVGRPDSTHTNWLGPTRTYDLLLVNYSTTPDLYAADADLYFNAKGFKLEIISQAIQAHQDSVRQYESIWLPDDDLEISSADINRLFFLFGQYRLILAQPAISNYNASHPETLWRFYSVLRYGNRVEMMCPLFQTDYLIRMLSTFGLNRSGWGIEWLWAQGLSKDKVAVIDAVTVRHLKSIEMTGNYYTKLAALGIKPLEEEQAVLVSRGITPIYHEFGVVYRDGWRRASFLRQIFEGIILIPFALLPRSRPLRHFFGIRRALCR